MSIAGCHWLVSPVIGVPCWYPLVSTNSNQPTWDLPGCNHAARHVLHRCRGVPGDAAVEEAMDSFGGELGAAGGARGKM